MSDSEIIYSKGGGTSFVGPDAVELFRVASLASSLIIFKAGMTMRGVSGAKALKMATRYTGVTYKRGEYDRARADLKVWIETMKSAIPSTVRE